MSPAEIKIALHYWVHPYDYDGIEAPNFVMEVCEKMVRAGLLRYDSPEVGVIGPKFTRNEEAMKVYVEALCAIPWPVQVWVVPKVTGEGGFSQCQT